MVRGMKNLQVFQEAFFYTGIFAIITVLFLAVVFAANSRNPHELKRVILVLYKDYTHKRVVLGGLLGFMRLLTIFGAICIVIGVIGYGTLWILNFLR
jgi:hypothetical protein